jgi:hypothetical protein
MVGWIPEALWALPRRLRDATPDAKTERIILSGDNQAKRCGLTLGSSAQITVADAERPDPAFWPPRQQRLISLTQGCALAPWETLQRRPFLWGT